MKKAFLKYQLKYWIPVYLYLLLIFYFSSQQALPASSFLAEKLYMISYIQHIFIYTGLALIINRATNHSNNGSNSLVIFSTTLYGITDEIHQYFVPGRTFELLDIGMDFLGAILALIIIGLYRKIR